jgi:hypothetical protein
MTSLSFSVPSDGPDRAAAKDLWQRVELLQPFGYRFAFGVDNARLFGSHPSTDGRSYGLLNF